MSRKRVFIVSEDVQLAQKLVRLLEEHGITGFWVSEEQGEKLEQLWRWDACIREVHGDGALIDRSR